MKLTYSMIQQFLPQKIAPEELAEKLTLLGIEVENIENAQPNFTNVMVGEILSVEDHPNAKKLVIAKVTDGKETHQVVCGASNCREGLKTAFARIGAKLGINGEDSFTIKKSNFRDVESHGMLASMDELIGGPRQEGIIEFSDEISVGTNVADILWDPVFEISLTPNLGHCLSAYGVARELCSLLQKEAKNVSSKITYASQKKVSSKIACKDSCYRYSLQLVEDVKIGASPFWLKHQLELCGIQSINNIVDITNYVMLELGQPMHAFDLQVLDGEVQVALSKSAFELECLDGQKRSFPKNTLIIQDAKKPLAIAGVIGGKESSITETTKDIVFEAAVFDPMQVRRASKSGNLRTESSNRFEKGVDPEMTKLALQRACSLAQDIAGGKISKNISENQVDFSSIEIRCKLSKIEKILATKFSLTEVLNFLKHLHCRVKPPKEDTLIIHPPSYRYDLRIEEDIIEEIARLYGYQNLSRHLPRYVGSKLEHDAFYLFERAIRNHLVSLGLQEFIHCDLISPELAKTIQEFHGKNLHCIEVLHAKSSQHSILRPSLLPGFLQTIQYNQDRKNVQIHGFEIGRIALQKDKECIQQPMVGLALSGDTFPMHWGQKPTETDFFDLKGILQDFFRLEHFENIRFKKGDHPSFHPYRQTNLFVEGTEIGVMGELHPSLLHSMDIESRVFYSEINLQYLYQMKGKKKKIKDLNIYPGSIRDWTLTLKDEVPISEVYLAIYKAPSSFLEKVELIDLYKSEKLGHDKKNVTFRFSYRDSSKTLSLEEVEKEHEKILKNASLQLKELIIS